MYGNPGRKAEASGVSLLSQQKELYAPWIRRMTKVIPVFNSYFYSDLMGLYGDLMGFYGDLMGY